MEVIEGPLQVEQLQETPTPQSQPQIPTFVEDRTVSAMPKAEPTLDDAQVRQAIAKAEAQGLDPQALTVGDLEQGQTQNQPPQAQTEKVEVPEKFLKPDGEVDVEKLKTSTRQLDEALKAKETEVQKTVDDYVRDYREKEAKYRSLPNPEKLAKELPKANAPVEAPPTIPEDQLRERLRADLERDPLGTMSDLVDIIVQRRLQPYAQEIESTKQEKRDNAIRENLAQLAKSDPRVLNQNVYNAINRKLEEEPGLWNLKNPHKAAWLEVKEELRLGEYQTQSAQPSRNPSPVLGGGTPPSSPSSPQVGSRPVNNLAQLDPRDKRQEAMGDEFIRTLLARDRRA